MKALIKSIAVIAFAMFAQPMAFADGEQDPLPGFTFSALEVMTNPSSKLLAKVVKKSTRNFYGTALLFHTDDKNYYFLTNAHVLASSLNDLQDLALISPVKYYDAESFEVLAYSFGYDLAVLKLRKQSDDLSDSKELQSLLSLVFYQGDPARELLQVAILGFPGHTMANEWLIPVLHSNFIDNDLRLAAGEQRMPSPEMSFPIRVEKKKECVIPFLDECYYVPLLSWGFSGGVLQVLPASAEPGITPWPAIKILGIVSHFEPLSDKTHVIPIDTAIKLARFWLTLYQGQTLNMTDDTQGLFRAETPGVVSILSGPLAGAVVSSPNGNAPGGHEGVGGGGNGGSDDLTLYSEKTGCVAFLDKWDDLVKELVDPSVWSVSGRAFNSMLRRLKGLRGVSALLHYRPEITVTQQNGSTASYQLWGDRAVPTLQSFLKQYREDPAKSFENELRRQELPQKLDMPAALRGYHALTNLNRFKPYEQIEQMQHEETLTKNALGFQLFELLPLLQVQKEETVKRDIIIGLGRETYGNSITAASLEVANGETKLRLRSKTVPREWTITLPAQLQSEGPDFYVYRGPARVNTAARIWNFREVYESDAYLVAVVQKLDSQYELKIIMGHQLDIKGDNELIDGSPLSRDQIVLDGIFVPLQPSKETDRACERC